MTTAPERLVLDTDIVIHLLKKEPETMERFLRLREQSVVYLLSPIVVAEVYAGAFPREYPTIEGFFGLCARLSLDMETARLAGQYAHRHRKAYQGVSLATAHRAVLRR